jgi:hypothetical protein
MILRRLTQHVKDQNWFAVGLDFVIVVVGVFLGFQVTEWNAQRLARLDEQSLIERLTDEFTTLETVVVQRTERAERLVADTAGLIEFVRRGEEPADDTRIREMIRIALLLYNAQVPPPTSFSDALQSGRIGSLENDDLRQALYEYQISTDWWSTVRGPAPSQIDPDSRLSRAVTQSAEVSREESIRPEILSYDWAKVREAERELVAIHHHQALQAEAYRLELAEIRQVLSVLRAAP